MTNTKYTLCLKNGRVMIGDTLQSTNIYILNDKILSISDKSFSGNAFEMYTAFACTLVQVED